MVKNELKRIQLLKFPDHEERSLGRFAKIKIPFTFCAFPSNSKLQHPFRKTSTSALSIDEELAADILTSRRAVMPRIFLISSNCRINGDSPAGVLGRASELKDPKKRPIVK